VGTGSLRLGLPVSAGVRCVQHYCYLGLLPASQDGYSEVTALYIARYGAPPSGTVVYRQTRQQIDGWTDVPKVTSAKVPAPSGYTPLRASALRPGMAALTVRRQPPPSLCKR